MLASDHWWGSSDSLVRDWSCVENMSGLLKTFISYWAAHESYAHSRTTFHLYATCTSSIMRLICPPKFCITFVFHFFQVLQPFQEKWKTMLMQNFGEQIRCILGDVQVAYVYKRQNGGWNSQEALHVTFPLQWGSFLQGGDGSFQVI